LIVTGKPCNGPSASPDDNAASAAFAPSSAASAASAANALTRGSSASIRASTAVINSTGDNSFARIRRAASAAGMKQRSVSFIIATFKPNLPRRQSLMRTGRQRTRRRDAEAGRHGRAAPL
jgi:hypothetical protein